MVSDNPFKDWPVASEVAVVLGVHVRTVYRYLAKNKLAGRDVSGGDKDSRYRIDPASVAKLKAGKPCKPATVGHVGHGVNSYGETGNPHVNISEGAELLHGQAVSTRQPPDNLTKPIGAD